jgi:hypothetical protein
MHGVHRSVEGRSSREVVRAQHHFKARAWSRGTHCVHERRRDERIADAILSQEHDACVGW